MQTQTMNTQSNSEQKQFLAPSPMIVPVQVSPQLLPQCASPDFFGPSQGLMPVLFPSPAMFPNTPSNLPLCSPMLYAQYMPSPSMFFDASPMLPPTMSMVPPGRCMDQPLYFDGQNFQQCPEGLLSMNEQGIVTCPNGYSLVSIVTPEVEADYGSVSSDDSPEDAQVFETKPIAEKKPLAAPEKQQQRKFGHRSKQNRIMEVHAELKHKYTKQDLFASEDEVLRGADTLRVHVKTFKALNIVHLPLREIEKHPEVEVSKISLPFSMKNKFQKKGFILYIKLKSTSMAPFVQEIFGKYSREFPKCDVALSREEKLRLAAKDLPPLACEEAQEHWDDAWDASMFPMAKQGSLQAA